VRRRLTWRSSPRPAALAEQQRRIQLAARLSDAAERGGDRAAARWRLGMLTWFALDDGLQDVVADLLYAAALAHLEAARPRMRAAKREGLAVRAVRVGYLSYVENLPWSEVQRRMATVDSASPRAMATNSLSPEELRDLRVGLDLGAERRGLSRSRAPSPRRLVADPAQPARAGPRRARAPGRTPDRVGDVRRRCPARPV
jgi:hypothetical protein